VPWYGIRNGRQQVGDFFATLAREVDFTRFEPKVFAAAGDHVLVHVDIGYRFRKNGQSASVGSLHEFTLRDGIVTSFRAYEDTASVRDAWNA
jgi:ketosteroid isomerase-like protein